MRRLLAATAVSLAALAVSDGAPCEAKDDVQVFAYRPASWTGADAPSAEVARAAADLVTRRCKHAGFEAVVATASKEGDRIDVRLDAAALESEAVLRRLIERRGAVEFRVRADKAMEDEYRDRRLQADAPPPAGFEWREQENDILQALVEVPEKPFAAKLAEVLKKSAADSAEAKAAQADLDKALAADVFTNADVAAASVRRSLSTHGAQALMHVAVRFEFKEERRAAFEKFTGDHIGRGLCVVLDGKVHVCPAIKSALPGMGEIRAPGTGYTEEQAREMAAILECGALPCKLMPEKGK